MFKVAVRYVAAFLLLIYGFAKINGSQFTILDSELDKPMGQVSGFWLTWYYFGYSAVYGTILALTQIGGALLLTVKRTSVLGALILIPVLGNIVLIDFCYGVDTGAAAVAVLLMVAMLWLASEKAPQLLALLLPADGQADANWSGWGVRIAMAVVACSFTYWVANYNNRAPTVLDGAWSVAGDNSANIPNTIFFEHNRAHMVVLKFGSGAYETHHFEVEPATQKIRFWEKWLRKGERLFEGTYALNGPELLLRGEWKGVGRTDLHLGRKSVRLE